LQSQLKRQRIVNIADDAKPVDAILRACGEHYATVIRPVGVPGKPGGGFVDCELTPAATSIRAVTSELSRRTAALADLRTLFFTYTQVP
jgi:hypothetical protein